MGGQRGAFRLHGYTIPDMSNLVYLDNNATTKPLAEVVDAMTAVLTDSYGNPSSVHQFGQAARHLVELASIFLFY